MTCDILDLVIPCTRHVPQEAAFHASWIKLRAPSYLCTMDSGNFYPALGSKDMDMGNILVLSCEQFHGYTARMLAGRDEVVSINGVCCNFSPIGMA